MLEANPSPQVNPRVRLLSMLSLVNLSPASRSDRISVIAWQNAPMQSSLHG